MYLLHLFSLILPSIFSITSLFQLIEHYVTFFVPLIITYFVLLLLCLILIGAVLHWSSKAKEE